MVVRIRQVIIPLGGFLFALDLFFKYLSAKIFFDPLVFFHSFGWWPFKNYGIAFGLPLPNIITICLSIIFLLFLGYYFFKTDKPCLRSGLLLIILGSISNLFDRFYFGYIHDYLYIIVSVFNLADILILLGVVFCSHFLLVNKNDK